MIQKVVVNPTFATQHGCNASHSPLACFTVDITERQTDQINSYLGRYGEEELLEDRVYVLWIDTETQLYEGTPIQMAICTEVADESFDGASRIKFHIVEYKEWERGD